MSAEENEARAAKAALVSALRGGRDSFMLPIYPGGFSDELARAIEAVVDARIAVRERQWLDHLAKAFPDG